MGHLIGLLVAASVAVIFTPTYYGVEGVSTPGRMGDEDYLKVLVEGTMTMMTDVEMNEMDVAPEEGAEVDETENEPKFRAEITELPDTVDCLGLPSWIASPFRKLFAPKSSTEVDTQFFLSTRSNRAQTKVPWGKEFSASAVPGYDSSHRTVVIVHGFMSGGNEEWIVDMTNAILDQVDANVFAVDWSGGGGSWKYWEAVANTRVTGNDIARFMEQLINEAGLRTDDLHLVGHSLGAHICGFVARSLKNVARITGLDPAQPCFKTTERDMSLDSTDAKFVDVIHTNGRMLSKLGLGLPYDIGHSDFYPNGGRVQPVCELKKKVSSWKENLWGLFLPKTYKLYQEISKSICSHGCAYFLFTESVRKSKSCSFWGHPWDMRTESEHAVFERPCDMSRCSEMGYNSDIYPARGGFFVKATDTPPFCVSDRETDGEMAMSNGVGRR